MNKMLSPVDNTVYMNAILLSYMCMTAIFGRQLEHESSSLDNTHMNATISRQYVNKWLLQ